MLEGSLIHPTLADRNREEKQHHTMSRQQRVHEIRHETIVSEMITCKYDDDRCLVCMCQLEKVAHGILNRTPLFSCNV